MNSNEIFYMNISSFIEYPTLFLHELASKFEMEIESKEDIIRLIGLLKLDRYALTIAMNEGVHPITGINCKDDMDIINLYITLRNRNNKMIEYLEERLVENNINRCKRELSKEIFIGE